MQFVFTYLQPFRHNLILKCASPPKIAKINKTMYFGHLRSFKVIDVSTFEKLVTSVCCERQQFCAYLQPFYQ